MNGRPNWQQAAGRSQELWVALSIALLFAAMAGVAPAFLSYDNLYNITRNCAYVGIMALGQTAVLLSGGLDLSVGSVMGLSGVVCGLVLQAGAPLWLGLACGLGTGLCCGVVNGVLIACWRLSPFVVTLGMLSIARSLALVIAANRVIYEFGPGHEMYLRLASGDMFGMNSPFLTLIVLVLLLSVCFRRTRWGRYLYAIGGNEQAARVNGIPIRQTKILAYALSGLLAGLSAILMVGWLGAVTNALGTGYELAVIAAAVIGGVSLLGGEGTAAAALVGALLLEAIRNALLLAGVDPFWQGTFVGTFLIIALVIEKLRRRA